MESNGEATPAARPVAATSTSELSFSVDTHLLKELGALLVGRDSTAIVELIKNAYDADAREVVVHGEELSSSGFITVSDNGHGMTEDDFKSKFLRIAGRSKEGGTRRSPDYGRRFTGAKGIGRLSAHKLGAGLRLASVPNLSFLGRSSFDAGFTAFIDWEAIERSNESIEKAKNISVERDLSKPSSRGAGTTLTINRLHSKWSKAQLNRFLAEVRSTRPDTELVGRVNPKTFPGEHLFRAISISDSGSRDPGFTVELSGDFAGSESQWADLIGQMNWMIEIDASRATVTYRMTPSAKTVQQNETAEQRTFVDSRKSKEGPIFRARFFVRDGSTGSNTLKGTLDTFAKDASGIRVYSEGFRVLPYGGSRNDWLGIDADYTQRSAIDVEEEQMAKPTGAKDINERVYARPGSAYFGGVFLHDVTSHGLEMVVNREGFLPNEAFEEVQATVRKGVELSVRVRAAVGQVRSDEKAADKRRQQSELRDQILQHAGERDRTVRVQADAATGRGPSSDTDKLSQLMRVGAAAASNLVASGLHSGKGTLDDLQIINVALDEARSVLEAAREEQSQLRVLASIGTQMGAFVHEINGILGQARTIRSLLDQMLEQLPGSRADLRQVQRAQDALISSLERQAVYLSDSLGAEARRRRVRQKVHERVATAFRLLTPAAAARNVQLVDETSSSARTLPMFPAELNVVFTNVISNAIKAAATDEARSGQVILTTRMEDGAVTVLVSNTGVVVDLSDAERWFRPFESTTSQIDTLLGQGLGLGLPLTRRIVEEYGGSITFVSPDEGMSTALEITLPTT